MLVFPSRTVGNMGRIWEAVVCRPWMMGSVGLIPEMKRTGGECHHCPVLCLGKVLLEPQWNMGSWGAKRQGVES